MLSYLCLAWIVLSVFDALYTISMLEKHGVEIEMNRAIRALCAWWGIPKGVSVGIFIPALAIAGLCWLFQAPVVMGLFVGARFMLALLQIRTHVNR